jgi:hypothetical protein
MNALHAEVRALADLGQHLGGIADDADETWGATADHPVGGTGAGETLARFTAPAGR